MANSLRDELLRAGLVTEDQVRKANTRATKPAAKGRTPRRKPAARGSMRTPHAAPTTTAPKSAPTAADLAARAEAEARAKKKAARARVRALLGRQRLNDEAGEISHKFVIGNCIKGVYVSQEQQRKLIAGLLSIVYFERRAHVVTPETAAQVREQLPHSYVYEPPATVEDVADDDPYAAYQVPDDLVW